MVKISIAVNMIKAAVGITDAINALNKETETKAAQVATTEVAATPTIPTPTPTSVVTPMTTPTKTTLTSTDVPEFEACTCGWEKCRRIDESMEAAATSTTQMTPTTPTALMTPAMMMRANAPVFEACPCDGTKCYLNGGTSVSVESVDCVRPLVPLAQRKQHKDSKLAVTTVAKDKDPLTDELELETSEDEDQINEIVAELCGDHDTSAASRRVGTGDATKDDLTRTAKEETVIIRHELLVTKTSPQRDNVVVARPYTALSRRVEAA